jgi:hypothetical protein
MDKKNIIVEVIKLADAFENKGMVSIANRVTEVAVKLAYDFNNPRKEEIVDDSLSIESNPEDEKGYTHWYDDNDDNDNDDSDKVDFSNIFKELLVDDSLTKDFAFEKDEEDDDSDEEEIYSFDEENEGKEDSDEDDDDLLNEDSWNELFHSFIKDGDISRSQIEDALAVVLSKNQEFRDKTSAVLKYMTKTSEKRNKVMKLSQALRDMNQMFGKDIKFLQ